MAGASLNDLSRAGFRQYSRVSPTNIDAAADGSGKAPRTDIGTLVIHWTLYGLLLIQTVTGFLLYLGHGGWWVTVHSFTATAVLIYIVAHQPPWPR